jgi:putative membrane protein
MSLLFTVTAVVAALVHVLFWVEESLLWMRPAIYKKTFGFSTEVATGARLLAFNQGFYNLFLALGVAFGLAAPALGLPVEGRAVAAFALASMLGAALVLLGSKPAFWLGAAIQGVPPAVALLALAAR